MFDELNAANSKHNSEVLYDKILYMFKNLMQEYPQSKVLTYKRLLHYEFLNLNLLEVYYKMLKTIKTDYDKVILDICLKIMYRISTGNDKQYLLLDSKLNVIDTCSNFIDCSYAVDLSEFEEAVKEWKEEYSVDVGTVQDYEDLVEWILKDFNDYLCGRMNNIQLVNNLCEYVYNSISEVSIQLSSFMVNVSAICLVGDGTCGNRGLRIFLMSGSKMFELGGAYCGTYENYAHQAIFMLPLMEFRNNES